MSAPRKSFYVLLPLISFSLALLVAELFFAVFAPIPFSLERNLYYEPDPHTGFRHKPGSVGKYLNNVPAIANSRGQRDDEVAVPKPDDVFRILMVGDSFTVGANVEQDVAYPQVLERLLNQADGRRIEVVNTGTGGWAPFQYAQFVEHYAAEFEPDLLLLGLFVGNDTYVDTFAVDDTLTAVLGRRVSRKAGGSVWGAVKVFLYERSHVARLVLTKGYQEDFDFTRKQCNDFVPYFLGVQKTRLANHIAEPTAAQFDLLQKNVAQVARIKRWSEAQGIPLQVFVIPDENQVNTALQTALLGEADSGNAGVYNFENPQALLKPLFALEAIDWVDLRPALQSAGRCLYMNDSHWQPDGHAFVAGVIAEYLRDNGLVPAE